MCLRRVVFPLPKKPVRMVTGINAMVLLLSLSQMPL